MCEYKIHGNYNFYKQLSSLLRKEQKMKKNE